MVHVYALLSVVYMIGYVALFDRIHNQRSTIRFCRRALMSQEDAHRLMDILMACEE